MTCLPRYAKITGHMGAVRLDVIQDDKVVWSCTGSQVRHAVANTTRFFEPVDHFMSEGEIWPILDLTLCDCLEMALHGG